MRDMSFRALVLVGFSAALLACGGNVVVDHGSGAGGRGGSGGSTNTGFGGTTMTGIGGTTMTGFGGSAQGGFGGTTGDVNPVGVGGSTSDVSPVGVGGSSGDVNPVGVGGGSNVASAVSVGSGPVMCGGAEECSGGMDDCSCQARCNGHRVRISCGSDPGLKCSCFVDNHFAGNCQPSSLTCTPEQSCCREFF
jgi:hypothetical protein